ncbi:pilus assembly protein [Massilia sp. CF038]|uniref:pilus assembly protein n=1 Tax=Massilia sp. CF038 TaxID=1881045 RepID=UPI00090F1254|nr:PilC/PilY family type IV pilus protein [Massilia sp. CF038]SHG58399.1 type IV pilus assembly protein PilY1 [Massilia sp. CF038]
MSSQLNRFVRTGLLSFGVCMSVVSPHAAAATTDLADAPLANATTTAILPNIMFDLDNSGSMSWDYMPDFVRYTSPGAFVPWCRGVTSTNSLLLCEQGDPPYFASGFNGLYYNPEVRYSWPVNADGNPRPALGVATAISYANPLSWTAAASDGYGIQRVDSTATQAPGTSACTPNAAGGNCPVLNANSVTNLVTSYPERVWCLSSNDTPPSANCKSALEGNKYLYPNGTYKVMKVQYGAPYYYNVNVEWCSAADVSPQQNYGRAGTCQAKKDATYKYVRFFNWSRVDIKPGTVFPTKAISRTDCAGAACTYAEEMTNFATWYTWYRTRMQMTKSAIGLSFRDVRGTPKTGAALALDPADENFLHARVGMTTINNPAIVKIANFDAAQKTAFYNNLYASVPSGGTPLRTSLDSLGKMYSGTNTAAYGDPIQYSCQRNFTILATDGYWNDNYNPAVDDIDGAATVSRPSRDDLKTPDTLADIAYYYYHTDLRTNCTTPDLCTNNVPPSGANVDVDDVAQHQHMTTFTVSLGLDGTLNYDDAYKTSTSGDYFDIKQGSKSWPKVTSNSQETIDDLWHAAVNGRGTYFSTQDPNALEAGMKRALNSIERTTGSGAAAATSNLQPVAGDNSIFIATYRTQKWDGELSAYPIDLNTGAIGATAVWQSEALLRAKIVAGGDADTRVIYTHDGSKLVNFTATELPATLLAYFDNTKLSQYADWNAAQKSAATPALMIKALRGQDRYEDQDRDASFGAYQRLYRDREKVLGDIVHSQPIYVKAPPFGFVDPTYATFKKLKEARDPTLYVQSNDGMLHAFDGKTGTERWAYVPPVIMKDMWRLLDTNYENNHRYYLDGPLSMSDVQINGEWRTILIGGLGKGGRGYYAMDVTDPGTPKLLWNYTAEENQNMGYSYGTAYMTKLNDANKTWVAVLSSGYNNVPEGGKYSGADGKGYVFVLDLATGKPIRTITTNEGTASDPSGLAKLNVVVENFVEENLSIGAYGGDLYGNMWRINLTTGALTKLVSFGSTKPIMVAPEIGPAPSGSKAKYVVYFGSGRYLGDSDLTDVRPQSLFAIKDDASTTLTDMTKLVEQTVATTATSRTFSDNAIDWTTKFGWYSKLADAGERVTIDPQLFGTTVIFSTTVPTASACQPGGYSWLYQLGGLTGNDLKTDVPAGNKITSPIVGLTVATLPNGTSVIYSVTADGKTPTPKEVQLGDGGDPNTPSTLKVNRVMWRELFD